jgi:DNA repair protein RecO (recombination protein O)
MESQTEGIILQTRELRESDLAVHLYTKDYGLMVVRAPGAKRSVRRFGGLLQSFSQHQLTFRQYRGQWPILLVLEPINMRLALCGDLGAYAGASYAVELFLHLTREDDVNISLFELLASYLDYCLTQSLTAKALCRFHLRLLENLGLMPNLDNCLECGEHYDAQFSYNFDLHQGAILCSNCSAQQTAALYPLNFEVLQLLWCVQHKKQLPVYVRQIWTRAMALLELRIEHLLGFCPRSRSFLYQMNPGLSPDAASPFDRSTQE